VESLIVVVEDEPAILGLIGAVLQEEGYTVLRVGSPALLAALLDGCEPRLFLVDLMLPITTGIELARGLRAGTHTDIPIVAMSASDRMLTSARESGLFDATVRKPFDLDYLLQTVNRCSA
jgi:CheY-like chemotaxis protein